MKILIGGAIGAIIGFGIYLANSYAGGAG